MPFKQDFEYTSKELRQRIAGYMDACRESGRMPTDAGLALVLEVPIARLEVLAGYAYEFTKSIATQGIFRENHADEKLQYRHLEALQEGLALMRDEIQQHKDTMSLFRLKQPIYGGYTDKVDKANTDINVNVSIQGMKKGVDPFG